MADQEWNDLVARNLAAIRGKLDLVQTYGEARADAGDAALELHRAYGVLDQIPGTRGENAKDDLDVANEILSQAYKRTEGADIDAQIPPQIFEPLRSAIERAFITAFYVEGLAQGLTAASLEAWQRTLDGLAAAAHGAAQLPGEIIAPVAKALTPLLVVIAVLLVVLLVGRKRGLLG